jgi:hypothetical protein
MPENYQPQTDGPIFTVPSYTDQADGVVAFKEFADSLIDDLGGINADADRDGQVIVYDKTTRAGHWTSGPVMKVVETLPDDSDPAYAEGDVVFVTGDDDLKGSGGGSAVVSGSNGALEQKNVSIGGDTYDLYTFTDDTRNDLSLTVDSAGLVDVLMVGGGGSGGTGSGGGGGAGAVVKATIYLDAIEHKVVVGAGGQAPTSTSNTGMYGTNGLASVLGSIVSPGGGAGGSRSFRTSSGNRESLDGANGGCGGGAGGFDSGATGEGGLGILGMGNNGGRAANLDIGGGGGGAGSSGGNATSSVGGTGGDGEDFSSFIGSSSGSLVLAGGGGGRSTATAGSGGSGIGGDGGGSVTNGGDAVINTGSGGGGGANPPGSRGGNGSSGIVIVRVKV